MHSRFVVSAGRKVRTGRLFSCHGCKSDLHSEFLRGSGEERPQPGRTDVIFIQLISFTSYRLLDSTTVLLSKLIDLLKWYTLTFKDPLMMQPPPWFLTFVYCEALLQLPFFPVAAYAFYKGGCKWIRIPAIVYSTHVVTSVLTIIVELLFSDFPTFKVGPLRLQERLTLVSVYAPYLLIPLLLLNTMLYNPHYRCGQQKKQKSK
ncbi:sigma intracellular receptor 2 isoform X1 [Rhinatrema bivittatum]|uniref:sigma intracellular receptor 2 isoform X1 n=1 Tax=Rhinatrema bivittatum TaxID=194408 RepID=UPI00112EE473|nr:sigma intracellular receptor 2 isoform X1 [Rhinatrema bivittatum]